MERHKVQVINDLFLCDYCGGRDVRRVVNKWVKPPHWLSSVGRVSPPTERNLYLILPS